MRKIVLLTLNICLLSLSFSRAQPSLPVSAPLWKKAPLPPPMMKAEDSGFVHSGGAGLYYAVFNKAGADPVLLLHGGFTSSDYWSAEVPLLAKMHQVIVMDSRGQGRSTLGTQPFTYDLLTADALQVLDRLKVPKVSVVGWSDGGIIGLILAIHHPDRINCLFTYGTNYNLEGYKKEDPDSTIGPDFMKNAEANYRRRSATPDSFRLMRRTLGKMYSREPNLDSADLKKITAPVMIAYGRYEQFIRQEHFQEMADLIPTASLLMLPGLSHGGPLQDPAAFHRAIAFFLDGR